MDVPVEVIRVGDGLMGEVICLKVAPDCFDVIEFGRIFGRPPDAEPMGAERGPGRLAGMDRTVVENDDHGALTLTGFGATGMIEVFQKGCEVGAAPGFGGGDDQPAVPSAEGAHHRNLSGLAGADTRRSVPRLAHARAR